MTTPTPTGRRGLSLAWRIRLALVALVALTCAVLTGVATTTLQQSNEGRMQSMVTSDLLADTDAVGKTAMAHPEIRDTVALVVAVEGPTRPSAPTACSCGSTGTPRTSAPPPSTRS